MTIPVSASSSETSGSAPVRVLVVDDSAFMRFTITKRLNEAEGIHVVGAARDGQEALTMLAKLKPDVITLDVEMPRLDGLSTLREIMATHPCPVIMLSSLTTDGARETVQALTLGAVDFVAKPTIRANVENVIDEVITKIRRAVKARVVLAPQVVLSNSQQAARTKKQPRPVQSWDKIVVIGASTGGPRALNTVMPMLPADLPAAVVIVQHMPAGFTRSLAERLDSVSELAIREAAPGDRLEIGSVLIAPGGYHLTVDRAGQIALNQHPPVHGVRPSVDVTMTAIAQHFGASVVGVVLTGMGSDGANGAALIHAAGGRVIAEDESTCVVWGMPRSVIESGVADEVAPLPRVAAAIEKAVRA